MTEETTVETTEQTAEQTTEQTTEQTATPPEWLAALPDDLKGNETLTRYKDTEALARGHLETKKLASSKLSIPTAETTAEDWGKVWDALGRPESPDNYNLKLIELPVNAPDEARTALAESTKPFRELAHKIGLNDAQALALSEYRLQENEAYHAKGAAEIEALKGELGGDYVPKLARGQKAFAQLLGGDPIEALQTAQELETKIGSARLVKLAMRLGEVMGEHQLIDDDNVEGFGVVGDAQAKLDALQADEEWRKKLNAGDATVKTQRENLLRLAARQAARRGG